MPTKLAMTLLGAALPYGPTLRMRAQIRWRRQLFGLGSKRRHDGQAPPRSRGPRLHDLPCRYDIGRIIQGSPRGRTRAIGYRDALLATPRQPQYTRRDRMRPR